MSTPKRIQLSRKRGFRLPPNTVVVSRPSKWGNHWRIAPANAPIQPKSLEESFVVKTAAEAVANYTAFIQSRPHIADKAKAKLRGKNLACWCKPGSPCHADVLLKIANEI